MKKYFCDICGNEGTAPRLMISDHEIKNKRVSIRFKITQRLAEDETGTWPEADICHICLMKIIENDAKENK